MTTIKVYSEKVTMCGDMREYMLKCFSNHLDIYNEIVDYHYLYKGATYRQVKDQLEEIIADGVYPEVVKSALCNEIYYLYKKANYVAKCEDDVQYISGIASRLYKGKTFIYDAQALSLKVYGVEMAMNLAKSLPEVDEGLSVYINLSYSCLDDGFELSVFTSPDLEKKDPADSVVSVLISQPRVMLAA